VKEERKEGGRGKKGSRSRSTCDEFDGLALEICVVGDV
jgi:hypothetical protein